jgi:hypothetical protein
MTRSYSYRTRRVAAILASVLVCAFALAPAAFAHPALEGPPSSALSSQPQQAPRTVIERVEDGGFHVGDAAIGAGIGAALILVALGVVAAGRHQRLRFTH